MLDEVQQHNRDNGESAQRINNVNASLGGKSVLKGGRRGSGLHLGILSGHCVSKGGFAARMLLPNRGLSASHLTAGRNVCQRFHAVSSILWIRATTLPALSGRAPTKSGCGYNHASSRCLNSSGCFLGVRKVLLANLGPFFSSSASALAPATGSFFILRI